MLKTFEDLFLNRDKFSFIDVRSPLEFKKGHIPGAYNIPLFSDQLRALVGTIYVQEGKEKAMHVALQHVAPHFIDLIDQAKNIYKKEKKTLVVYCARGGMRSGSVSWLFNLFQLSVIQLARGYKGYRNWVLAQFLQRRPINLLCGKTGSGKTAFLHHLAQEHQQIIDLEALAKHKGSVFGGYKDQQATQQQFENDLAWQWAQLDFLKWTWIEDESRKIGSVIIPESIWLQMQESTVYLLVVSLKSRFDRVLCEYGKLDKLFLLNALEKIESHLGGPRYQEVKKHILVDEMEEAFNILLSYYDKKYEHGLKNKQAIRLVNFKYF